MSLKRFNPINRLPTELKEKLVVQCRKIVLIYFFFRCRCDAYTSHDWSSTSHTDASPPDTSLVHASVQLVQCGHRESTPANVSTWFGSREIPPRVPVSSLPSTSPAAKIRGMSVASSFLFCGYLPCGRECFNGTPTVFSHV